MGEACSGLLPAPVNDARLSLWATASPFDTSPTHFDMPEGLTIEQMLDRISPDTLLHGDANIYIGGHFIPRENWRLVRPKAGDKAIISIRVLPGKGGGKNPLRTILTIAVFAVAAWAASAYAVSAATALAGVGPPTAFQTAIASGVIKAGVGVAGSLLVNAIAPPAIAKTKSSAVTPADSPTNFIDGTSNQMLPYGYVPVLLGKKRFYPPQAAKPYTEVRGNKHYARQLFTWGYGKVVLRNPRIGDTDLASFQGVERADYLDAGPAQDIALFPNSVDQNPFNILMPPGGDWQVRSTGNNVDEIIVEFTWPNGLSRYDEDGKRGARLSTFSVRISPAGANTWTEYPLQITRSQTAAVREAFRFQVDKGKYDVGFKRTSGVGYDPNMISDAIYCTSIKGVRYGKPILMDGISNTAMMILGTDQLNGLVDQYSEEASRVCMDWDYLTESWIERETNNPASLYRFVLQCEANDEARSDAQIALNVLQDWHDYCRIRGFEYNAVVDMSSGSDVDTVLRAVAAAGRASPNLDAAGRESVIIDRLQTEPVQVVTPRNSWGYQYEKPFIDIPHGIIVTFLNEEKDGAQDEYIVYADGYNENNATKFVSLPSDGITKPSLIYKHFREHLASLQLRQDTHSFYMDIEHLNASRGNMILFAHDVVLIGLGYGRIDTVTTDGGSPAFVLSVTLDEFVTMEEGIEYAITWRRGDNVIVRTQRVVTVPGETKSLTFITPVAENYAPEPDDIFTFGESGLEYLELVIKTLETAEGNNARLICQNAAPEIFQASEGPIPDFNSGITTPAELRKPYAPIIDQIQSGPEVQVVNVDGSISSRMVITLQNRNQVPVEPVVKIRMSEEDDFSYASVISVSPTSITLDGLDSERIYDLRIWYRKTGSISINNLISDAAAENGIVFLGLGKPAKVENFEITVRGDVTTLDWSANTALNLGGYELRFTPDLTTPEYASSVPYDIAIPSGTTSLTVPSRTGSWLIKAFTRDANPKYSDEAAVVTSTISQLSGLNFIEEIVESDTWGGSNYGTLIDSGKLKLGGSDMIDDWSDIDSIASFDLGEDGMASGGTYVFENYFDLGGVFTSTISAEIEVTAENLGDLIDSWSSIDGREDWDGSIDPSMYDVTLVIKTTNADPATLGDPMTDPGWGEWKVLTIGDYTFRAIIPGVQLRSRETGVTPVIHYLKIKIDMEDRVEGSDGDITIPAGGLAVSFAAAFREKPAVAVALDNLASTDRYEITNRTESGFDIRIFNVSNVGIEKTGSWNAKGYGYLITP